MSHITQQSNTEQIQGVLGRVVREPNFTKIPAILNPGSTAPSCQIGDVVKIVAGSAGQLPNGPVIVDVLTGVDDASQVFGVVLFIPRKSSFAPGQEILIGIEGIVVSLLSSAAIVAGTLVATTPSTTANDPTVATDTTSGHQITGIALNSASAAGQLVNILVKPSTNP